LTYTISEQGAQIDNVSEVALGVRHSRRDAECDSERRVYGDFSSSSEAGA